MITLRCIAAGLLPKLTPTSNKIVNNLLPCDVFYTGNRKQQTLLVLYPRTIYNDIVQMNRVVCTNRALAASR
jgi:hypothetical protein